MSKKLEEIFDMTPTAEPEQAVVEVDPSAMELLRSTDKALDKIDEALPMVTALDASDTEMDDLANLAKDKFNDLMDLGMNVEPRFSGTIFQSAGVLLGHAITAKTAKIDKKLKMIQLQLQKAKLDQSERKLQKEGDEASNDNEIPGEATVVDRNSLLNAVIEQAKADMAKKSHSK